jgi:hypothetical protein
MCESMSGSKQYGTCWSCCDTIREFSSALGRSCDRPFPVGADCKFYGDSGITLLVGQTSSEDLRRKIMEAPERGTRARLLPLRG